MTKKCNRSNCTLCSQMIESDAYKFKCGFVFVNKDQDLNCTSLNVIYVLRCTTCHGEYIGETKNFRQRMNTHASHIRTKSLLCRATDHLVSCGSHLPDVKSRFEIFILEIQTDRLVRKARESFFINLFIPEMNK